MKSLVKATVPFVGKAPARRFLMAVVGMAAIFSSYNAQAQIDNPLRPLKGVPVPGPSDQALMQIVKDKTAAIQLGKALFWDPRVGSDNKTACATCHFTAGADNRNKNQVSPGLLTRFPNLAPDNPDKTFQLGGGPNYTSAAADFPLTSFNPVSSNDPAARLGQRCHFFSGRIQRRVPGCHHGGQNICRCLHQPAGSGRFQHPWHQHTTRRAQEFAVGDQCCVQLPQFLGWTREQCL
jgi:hypothetical protein